VSGEAILSAENSGKPLGTPLGEFTALPQTPIAGGKRVVAPSPRTPTLLWVFGASVLPLMKKKLGARATAKLPAVRALKSQGKKPQCRETLMCPD